MLAKVEKLLSRVMGGSSTERELKKTQITVSEINDYAREYESLTDNELKAKTHEFRYRLRMGETLDDILPEAFAAVKDTCRRLIGKKWMVRGIEIEWNMIPYDVQLMGGVVLHQGKIAEMATGEGKTLVATMPLYLNALEGKGVHLITVNDYLAQRDCEWMGEIYKFLGLTVAAIFGGQEPEERRLAYQADISYGTNNEYGFDYLRDNMTSDIWSVVQRPLHYAIVDEVDSVLIDEARTPLIISGSVGAPRNIYNELKPIVENLYNRQQELVTQLLKQGRDLLEKDEEEAGMAVLRALRGDPKNKELLELLTSEFWVKKLIERIQGQFEINKTMAVVDQELYYTIDEKSHVVDITEKGRIFLSGGRDQDVAYKIQRLDNLDKALHEISESKNAARYFTVDPITGRCSGFSLAGKLALAQVSRETTEQQLAAMEELHQRLGKLPDQTDGSVKKDRASVLRSLFATAKKMDGVVNGLQDSGRRVLLQNASPTLQELINGFERILQLLTQQADVDAGTATARHQQERRKTLQNTFFENDRQAGCPIGLTESGRIAILVTCFGGDPLDVPMIFQLEAMLNADDPDDKLVDHFEFSADGVILKHITEKGRISLLGGNPDLYVLPDRTIVEERDRQIQQILDRTLNQTSFDYSGRIQAIEQLERDVRDIHQLSIASRSGDGQIDRFYRILPGAERVQVETMLTPLGVSFYNGFSEQTMRLVEQLDQDMRTYSQHPEELFSIRDGLWTGLSQQELDRLLGASYLDVRRKIEEWHKTHSVNDAVNTIVLRLELDSFLGVPTKDDFSLSRRFEEIERIAFVFENLFTVLAKSDVIDADKRRLLKRYFELSETVKSGIVPNASLPIESLSSTGLERMAGQAPARLQIIERLLAVSGDSAGDFESKFELDDLGIPQGIKKSARSALLDGLPFFSYSDGLKKFRDEILFISSKKVGSKSELQGLLPKEKAHLRGKHFTFDERELNELLSTCHLPGTVMTGDELEHWFRIHFDRQPRRVLDGRRDRLWRTFSLVEERIQNISQLLRAYTLYQRDVEYVVKTPEENELRRHGGSRGQKAVMIVDQFTGRLMPGRRFSDGLHEALEAKEGVQVQAETQTLATITLQNFFRLYRKLAGMTGTAETESQEFFSTYKLEVVVIPTNRQVVRTDFNDVIFRTRREKFDAIVEEALEMHENGRPVLIGTISVDVSQHLSNLFTTRGIPMANWLQKGDVSRELESGRFHTVLNAKFHKSEAEIVSKAGLPGAITIATNMAGRGTDIKLAPSIAGKGGLHIIGSEKHEARRIDRQLRGRSGRQGDPGSSRFYLSLEDDLMRLFGSDRITSIMSSLGSMEEGERIEHPLITKSIERAQKKVEERNFEIRKSLLEYDDVLNEQRKIIYRRRQNLLGFAQPEDLIESKMKKFIAEENDRSTWRLDDLLGDLQLFFGQTPPFSPENLERYSADEIKTDLQQWVTEQVNRNQHYHHLQERHRYFGYLEIERILEQLVLQKIRLHNGGSSNTEKWNVDAIHFELSRLLGEAPEWLVAQSDGLGSADVVEQRIIDWAQQKYQQERESCHEGFAKLLFEKLTLQQVIDIFIIGLVNLHLPVAEAAIHWRTDEFLRDLERVFLSRPSLGANEIRSIRIEKTIEIIRDWLKGLNFSTSDREPILHRIFGFFTSIRFADSVVIYLFNERDGDTGELTAAEIQFLQKLFGIPVELSHENSDAYWSDLRRLVRKSYLDMIAANLEAYNKVMLGNAANEELIEAAIHAVTPVIVAKHPHTPDAQKELSQTLDNMLLSRPDQPLPDTTDKVVIASYIESLVSWALAFYKNYSDRIERMQQEELSSEIVSDSVLAMIDDAVYAMIGTVLGKEEVLDSNQISRLESECRLIFRQSPRLYDENSESMDPNNVMEQLSGWAKELYGRRLKELGKENVTRLERYYVLEKMDEAWRQHLNGVDELREGIGLRGYGQKDPLLEYKREAFDMFTRMIDTINRDTVGTLFKVFDVGGEIEERQMRRIEPQSFTTSHSQVEAFKQVMSAKKESTPQQAQIPMGRPVKRQPIVKAKDVGRNDPCPCGSGKKYKNCCGRE